MAGSPFATLFITVLFLPQLTEVYQYQRDTKDQASPDKAEAVSTQISGLVSEALEITEGMFIDETHVRNIWPDSSSALFFLCALIEGSSMDKLLVVMT